MSELMELEEYIRNKDDALQLIIDIGIDYDGFRTPESLMKLIDELVDIARIGLNKM